MTASARPQRRTQLGLTLLEMLVAVAILGVALVSMLALHARNVQLTVEIQEMTVAGMLASRLAAEIRSSPVPPDFGVETGEFNDDDDDVVFVGEDPYGGDLAGRFIWQREVDSLGPLFRRVRVAVGTEEDPELADLVFVVPGLL